MDHDQILEMVKRVRKACAEELKGKQHKIDMNKNGKLDAQDFEHLRKMKKEDVDLEEELKGAMHKDAPSVLKHIKPEHHGVYKPYLKKGVYQGGYKDRAAVLSAAEKAGHVKEEIELEEETKTTGVTITPATRRTGKQITTHHEHEGQKYKVTSEEDNEDGDLHHTIHKVDHEGKHSNETHYRSIRTHNYSVRPSKTIVVHDKLGKKVSSSLIDAHEKARSSAGRKALHRHEREMAESVELTQEDLDFIASLNQTEVVEGQLRNFSPHSDLAGRGRLSGYNKTAAGKKREYDRETERLKDKMKFTKGQGGIAGPKGKLPEEFELEEEQLNEIKLKTAASAYKKMSAGGNDMKNRTGMAGDQSDRLLAKMKKKWGDEKVNKAVREEADLDEAKVAPGSPFSKDYKSQMPDDQKTSTKTYHDVKKISTGTVYTKQSDAEGHSKGTGDDAAKKAEPPVKRGRGRPVGSKSGARQAGSASKTDYRGFVTHTLNLPASK